MRKCLFVLLAAVLAVAIALPATAGMEASGFYRAKGYVSNFYNTGASGIVTKDALTNAFVEQRFRVRFAFGEENVKAVWFSEVDFTAWGDGAGNTSPGTDGARRNSGGALGGDKINLETKNIFLWFKVPNTSLEFTVGLQGQSDSYAGLLYGGADMSGIFMTGKFDPVGYKLGWAKLYENASNKSDDLTLYVAEAKFSPTKEVKLGLNFYFLQDDTGKVVGIPAGNAPLPGNPSGVSGVNKIRVYTPGVDASFNLGPLTLSGFALYNIGKVDFPTGTDTDIKGYAVDVRGDMNLGPGKFFLEGLYVSGSDQSGSNPDFESVVTLSDRNASPGGNSAYSRTDMVILLSSPDHINAAQCLIGCSGGVAGQSPSNGGRGMWHVAAGYSQKFTDKVSGKIGVGYLRATEMLVSDGSFRDEEMGTEINASLNYNLMKGLDVGIVGAYAFIGDFFKTSATGSGSDPDDAYDIHGRINYAF
jgi:hypothetical protein